MEEGAGAGAAARDLTDRFVTVPGARVMLWAESPQLFNPTAMDVDERGRVWVAEAVNYRRWGGRNPGRDHEGGDRIVILEDTDGDGDADTSRVFVQDPDLTAPLGICVVGPRVYVSCSPHIFVYTDEDGDDISDSRETFLTGFGGFDHDHGVHSVVTGDDGFLYIAAGNAGPHIVTGADGFRLRSGSIYTGGTPYNGSNTPGLRSSDGRVWSAGIILRIRPDGTEMQVLAHNFRNEYEVALDSFGNLFTADNDDDGNRSCRTTWVAEGGNYGYFSEDGQRSWRADRRPGQTTQRAHWHADDPGVLPPGTINGAGGPTGVAVYEARGAGALTTPAGLYGAVLNCDAGAGVVYAHAPRHVGGGLGLEGSILLGRAQESGRAPGDGEGAWFRPSDVVVAPDGSIFVADWYDPGVGGHAARDRESYGRILRVSVAALARDYRPLVHGSDGDEPLGPFAGLIAALASPAASVRGAARERLIIAGAAAIPDLEDRLRSADARQAARVIWVLARLGEAGVSRVMHMLDSADPHLRVTAFRALRAAGATTAGGLSERLARDTSPLVRAAVARSLRDQTWQEAGPALLQVAMRHEPGDRYHLESLGIGAQGKEEELGQRLLRKDDARALPDAVRNELLWRLHPASALHHLAAIAMEAGTAVDERRRTLDAIAFIPSREAADVMYAAAFAGPPDLRAHAHFWLQHRAGNLWRDHGLALRNASTDMEGADLLWSSGIVTGGIRDVDVALDGAEHLWLVATDGEDGNSCDWADWIAPRFVMGDGEVVPLASLGWVREESGWGTTNLNSNCAGGPLRIGGDTFSEGIGTHAQAVVSFAVPAGARRLAARVGPDDGGSSQGCGTTIEFQVWARLPADRSAVMALRAALLDEEASKVTRAEAARELASSPEGGLFLIDLAREGLLDAQLIEASAPALYKNPDLGVRALASAHFPLPGADGRSLPAVTELLALTGNARAGHEVFMSKRAQCSACHSFRGYGADIGPDLTAIGTKYAAPEVFDAILNPSAAIAFGYDTYLFATEEGLLYSGFLLADGDDVILKDTQGRRHTLAAGEIAARRKQDSSVMPDGVALDLSAQELADLVAFLLTEDGAEPEFGPSVELFNGRDLTGWTHHLSDPSVGPDTVWSVNNGVLRCSGRPAGYIRTEADYESFELTLEWRFDPQLGAGNSGVLLRMVGEDKVWPKSIEAQLHSGNAGDIWNIDAFPMVTDPHRTSGRRTRKAEPTFELPIGGWNQYRIRLDHGDLTLEVNGTVQNRASWCEVVPGKICLQSEGACIEFRKILLRPIID